MYFVYFLFYKSAYNITKVAGSKFSALQNLWPIKTSDIDTIR